MIGTTTAYREASHDGHHPRLVSLPVRGCQLTAEVMTGVAKAALGTTAEAVIEELLADAGLLVTDGGPIEVSRLSGGHSHVTWMVAQSGGLPARFVIKVAENDGPLAPYAIEHEVSFTRLAREHGLPSPRVVLVSESNRLAAPLFAMDFVEGDAPTPREIVPWLEDNPGVTRSGLASQVVRTLVAMKGVVHGTGEGRAMAEHYRAYVDGAAESMAKGIDGVIDMPKSVTLVRRWLLGGAEILGDGPLSLVHGDFRFGNLLLHEGQIAAILDWERGMWGHHLHDLAYLSLPSMRYGGRVAGLVDDAELADLWREETGAEPDLAALSYLRTVSIFTELCACLRALAAFSKGRGRTSLLRILPIIARHEVDMLDALQADIP